MAHAVTDGIGRIIDMELRCSHAAEDMFRHAGATYDEVVNAMRLEFWELPIPVIEARTKEALRRASRNGVGPDSEAVTKPVTHPVTEPVTFRTLADLDTTPPGDLLLGMLEPEGPTLIYGAGGVGKGMTVTWMIRDLLRAGLRPLVYDAENRPKEWARRAYGLGIDRGQVVYMQPHELPDGSQGKPFWDVAPHVARVAEKAECDVVFIDSVLAAVGVAEERLRSDASAPYRYVAALDNVLGLPSVSIGHTSKDKPEGEPYGAVSWVNAMRLTWLGTRATGDGHRIRWRPRKRNERGRIDAVQLAFHYQEDGLPSDVKVMDDERTTREWVTDALMQGPLTVEELADVMVAQEEEYSEAGVTRAKDLVRQTLHRMKRQNRVHRTGRQRGAAWALGGRRGRT